MKIIATSDWHLGNLFHGNDRLSEHEHFLKWLLQQLEEHRPEALLVAGDIFDNGNPSAAAQSLYYNFLYQATTICPTMKIIITVIACLAIVLCFAAAITGVFGALSSVFVLVAFGIGAAAYFSEIVLLTDCFTAKIPHQEMFMAYCFGPMYVLLGISYLMGH